MLTRKRVQEDDNGDSSVSFVFRYAYKIMRSHKSPWVCSHMIPVQYRMIKLLIPCHAAKPSSYRLQPDCVLPKVLTVILFGLHVFMAAFQKPATSTGSQISR